MIYLDIQNISSVKHLYRRQPLVDLAERICRNEKVCNDVELSLVFCDDAFIRELNERYRGMAVATDVLSFQQEGPLHGERRVLGDIVISLETVQRVRHGHRPDMREETRLLFCHGLLHLLGYTHGRKKDKSIMQEKQALYLDTAFEHAWH